MDVALQIRDTVLVLFSGDSEQFPLVVNTSNNGLTCLLIHIIYLLVLRANSKGIYCLFYPATFNIVFQDSWQRDSLSNGYRIRAGSGSPVRHRNADYHHGSDFDHSGGLPLRREFGSRRGRSRFRDSSPTYGRARGGGRPFRRRFDGPGVGPGPFRGEGMSRNNPNVHPREGDWTCHDPLCGNLNFARREYCNSCNRPRYLSGGSPRRGYPNSPPPNASPKLFPGPPPDRPPGRTMNGYMSPPRGWTRHEGRFSDHPTRMYYPEDDYIGSYKFMDRGIRDRGRESFFNGRRGHERRTPSPLPLPQLPSRGRWARDGRKRSRSPLQGGRPPKVYPRDMYMERGRDRAGNGY